MKSSISSAPKSKTEPSEYLKLVATDRIQFRMTLPFRFLPKVRLRSDQNGVTVSTVSFCLVGARGVDLDNPD